MPIVSELLSLSSSFEISLAAVLTGLAALPLLGLSLAAGDESEEPHAECRPELPEIKSRIAELEAVAARTLEQNEELADRYVDWASIAFEEGEEPDVLLEIFGKAEAVLTQTLRQGEDTEIRRRLGNVYLHRAVVLNDHDDLEAAIESYGEAIATLHPLEAQGDGEAKYDIAGIRLNRGTIYHEIGDFEKAQADLDDSFTAFRAVEKISDLDTRYYMAKVSVAQGSLFRDMEEPLDKVVDAYNRAMRLFVELIDIGQLEHERELANTLMDRCSATYEDYMNREFESETERMDKFGDVLVDVGRAVEILEKRAAGSSPDGRVDLFHALTTEGVMLLDLDKYPEAKGVFDRVLRDFADFAEDADPVLLNQYAAAYENRGFCSINLDDPTAAIADFDKSIEIREAILGEQFDMDEDEKAVFLPSLATAFANRANAHAAAGNAEAGRADCRHGLELIRSLKETMGNDGKELFGEVEQMFENLLEQWK